LTHIIRPPDRATKIGAATLLSRGAIAIADIPCERSGVLVFAAVMAAELPVTLSQMTEVVAARLGRPAAATREEAFALARAHYLEGRRVDVQGIARELGLARTTMHRWFGPRDDLLSTVLATLAEERMLFHRRRTSGGGASALVAALYSYNRELVSSVGLRALLEQEQERALRLLTWSEGLVQPRMIATMEQLIDAEVAADQFRSSVASETLAYAIVRLGEAFIYNDAAVGIRGDIDRLRDVHAALLGAADTLASARPQ
jgi:AcrR family transcriptional regulator